VIKTQGRKVDSPHRNFRNHKLEIFARTLLLDTDLASMYEVSTKRLNEQVRRNSARFPGDFTFTLSDQEVAILRSQFATSSWSARAHGGRRYSPRVFTEHGAIMVATILNTSRAV
jgi:hypothetical protein